MEKTKFVELDNRQTLKVFGDDARDFLQGLVSNDLRRVSDKKSIYAALLTPQGKYLHDFFISEIDGAFYFDCEAVRIEELFNRLNKFKLRSNVQIEINNNVQVVALFGANLSEIISISPGKGSTANVHGGIIFIDPRLEEIGGRAILEKDSLNIIIRKFELEPSTFQEWDALRVSLGLPDGSRDLKVDKSILLESGFEELNGVDFEKGCYVGQELTARTKHRGLIKKRITPVHFEDTPPKIGTVICEGDNVVGEIRSVAGFTALALLRIDAINNSKNLRAGGKLLKAQKPFWANF